MGATYQEYKIELIDNIHVFFRRTGKLSYYKELEWLGFQLESITGGFRQTQVVMLLDFCKNNPEYHIITQTHPGRYINCFIPGKRSYFLGNGEKNANLVLNPFIRSNADLFAENMLDTTLAMFADINRGNDCK